MERRNTACQKEAEHAFMHLRLVAGPDLFHSLFVLGSRRDDGSHPEREPRCHSMRSTATRHLSAMRTKLMHVIDMSRGSLCRLRRR